MMELNQFDDFIAGMVQEGQFVLGKEIVEGLNARFGVTPVHARKLIQRTADKGIISTSKPATFGKGQYIYFPHEKSLGLEAIRPICEKFRPPLARVLDALAAGEGILSYYEALKICSSPLEDSSSKNSMLKELILMLDQLKLIVMATDARNVRYMIDRKVAEEDHAAYMDDHYSKMVLDCVFLPDILKWLRKVNIIDNLKTLYRSKLTPSKGMKHNNLPWDAYGYTKTTGINPTLGAKANTIEKQTLVVLDVVVHRPYEQFDLDGFLGRVQINVNSVKRGTRKVVPIVFYKEMSEKTENTLRSLGFLSFNIDAVFGKRIHEILDNVSVAQRGIFASDTNETEKRVEKSLKAMRAAGQEENLSNLKGTLFEYLFYPVFKSLYPNAMIVQGATYSEKLPGGGKKKYEYDFIIQSDTPKEIVVVELKGYSSEARIPVGNSDTQNTLSWFFGKTLPFVKKQFEKELAAGSKWSACYITSAGYWPDGAKYLEAQNNLENNLAPKKLSPYYDGTGLLAFLQENGFTHIKKTVERYFVNKDEPITAGPVDPGQPELKATEELVDLPF
jgi:hypothetical protein